MSDSVIALLLFCGLMYFIIGLMFATGISDGQRPKGLGWIWAIAGGTLWPVMVTVMPLYLMLVPPKRAKKS